MKVTFPDELYRHGPYKVLLVDAPIQYRMYGFKACPKYPLLTKEERCDMPVPDICDPKGCVLFMWATMPKLEETLEIINAWGFKYITTFLTWVKTNPKSGTPFIGCGSWTRSNCELLLLATKGRHIEEMRTGNRTQAISSVLMTPRPNGEHSRKPEEARERIEKNV